MSSKDMCTIELIPKLIRAGIHSFKIEGRMKSAYYTAVVTNAYRMAIDAYLRDPDGYEYDPRLLRELESVSHREYCTGFYLDEPMENPQLSTMDGYLREKAYFATAMEQGDLVVPSSLAERVEKGEIYPFLQRNKVSVGDVAEIISPSKFGRAFRVEELYDENGVAIPSAPHPYQVFFCRVPFAVTDGDIMRSGDTESKV